MISCPECEGTVLVADAPRLSEIIECGDCHVELEIMTIDPVRVALAPEVEEDWGE